MSRFRDLDVCGEKGSADGKELKCQRLAGHGGPHVTKTGIIWKDGVVAETIPRKPIKLLTEAQIAVVEHFSTDDIKFLDDLADKPMFINQSEAEGLLYIKAKIENLREAFGVADLVAPVISLPENIVVTPKEEIAADADRMGAIANIQLFDKP